MTSLIFWISAQRLAMFSLYLLIAFSVLLYSSWSTSFSEVTASNFSESALAVDSSCCRLVMRSSSQSLFLRRVCCSISFSRFNFFLFYRSSSSCASSRRHFAAVSFSALCVIASWFFSDLYMFYAASRWLRMEWYSFQSCAASLRSFRQAACVLSWSSLALVIFAANSLRITLSCINKIINYKALGEGRKGRWQSWVLFVDVWVSFIIRQMGFMVDRGSFHVLHPPPLPPTHKPILNNQNKYCSLCPSGKQNLFFPSHSPFPCFSVGCGCF